jgi:hypothetical protein
VKPYRRHLIGLPLQRSIFSSIDRAPELIGLTGVLPDDRLGAWVNEDGDLFLDAENVERLGKALFERISPELLDCMERSLVSACNGVRCATELCRDRAPTANANEARLLIAGLGVAVRALIPFGILSKFVPDVLYKAFALPGDADTPRLSYDSPGTVLTREAFALFEECSGNDFPPDRLLAEWPAVPSVIAERVRTFCERHAGFGPLPWEAPGYEDPRYVFTVLRTTFAEGDSAEIWRRLRPDVPGRVDADIRPTRDVKEMPVSRDTADRRLTVSTQKALERGVVVWLEFLERETWYVRRAFYVGLVPLLHHLLLEYRQLNRTITLEDVLFLGLDELTAPQPDGALARSRREKYLGHSEYLIEYGISPGRFGAMLGGS